MSDRTVFRGEFADDAGPTDINEVMSALRNTPGLEVRETEDEQIEVVR